MLLRIPGARVLWALDSHIQRFSKGYAKVATQLMHTISTLALFA